MRSHGFIGGDKNRHSFWALFWDPVLEEVAKCRKKWRKRVSPSPGEANPHQKMENASEEPTPSSRGNG
eukprot:4311690-Prorocentrum_lima.AAC.1